MKHNEEKEIGKFYKSYLDRELRDPDIVRAKKQFIETYFHKEPFVFPFGWAVPAAGFIALCLLVYPVYLSVQQSWSRTHHEVPAVSAPAAVPASATSTAEVEVTALSGKRFILPVPDEAAQVLPSVMVKSVGSETGQVMIYKKSHQETPITIVWVFPGGK